MVPSLMTPPSLKAIRWQSWESMGKEEMAMGGIVFDDAGVPFVEGAHEGGADHLIGVAMTEAAGVHGADVTGWFEEDDRCAFSSGGDGGAEAAGG